MLFLKKLEQTSFGFPSEWKGVAESGDEVIARYDNGVLNLDINDVSAYAVVLGHNKDGVLFTPDLLEEISEFVLANKDTEIESAY